MGHGSATALDRTIGEIARSMEETFAGDNWVMVVTSDSGGAASRRNSGGSNWPLRGNQGEVWEGGMRTQALVTGNQPELIKAVTKGRMYSNGFMHLVDWHATILQLAHTSPASRAPPNDLDGESLWNSLMQDAPSPRSEFISNVSGRGAAIRFGDYKLVLAPSGGRNPFTGEVQGLRWPVRSIDNVEYLATYDGQAAGPGWVLPKRWKLFNIRTDPTEEEDLAGLFKEEVAKLSARYEAALQGRKSFGSSMLRCPDGCDAVLAKAAEVMRKHSDNIALNKCPLQEAAYPFWEEAVNRAAKPFSPRYE
ncbi:Arsi [Symbiodinium natans]|uniref:Arsi protein n=1 Tax=Symbiodinium natans TaxID=878477 RepID=A0A812I7Z1_9DINO|nr:Arsi [Symbiodinium natans]